VVIVSWFLSEVSDGFDQLFRARQPNTTQIFIEFVLWIGRLEIASIVAGEFANRFDCGDFAITLIHDLTHLRQNWIDTKSCQDFRGMVAKGGGFDQKVFDDICWNLHVFIVLWFLYY
jgi:hypothetical protein